jgi:hypothetical protein
MTAPLALSGGRAKLVPVPPERRMASIARESRLRQVTPEARVVASDGDDRAMRVPFEDRLIQIRRRR